MKTPEGQESSSDPLENFREEIRVWKKEQLEKKAQGEKYDTHADEIDPDILTEDERVLWEKHRTRSLTREDFNWYQRRATARQRFEAMLINAATYLVLREHEQKLRERGEQQQ